MKKEWKIDKSETLHEGWFTIIRHYFTHTLFDGGWSKPIDREIYVRGHVAAVLPYDPVEDTVVLIEQFRIGALDDKEGPWLIEVIAGMIEEGEKPDQVAAREANEEAGVNLTGVTPVREYFASPGATTEKVHVFCGTADLSNAGGVHGLASEDEDIRVIKCSAQEAIDLLDKGKIKNAISIIAMMWFKENHAQLRATL